MTTDNRQQTTDQLGFTLFEIMIAIFIFGIIVTTIFGSFTKVFSTTEAIKKGMGSYEMVKNCLNRMILDLNSIYVISDDEYTRPAANDDPDPYRFVGDASYAGTGSFSRLRLASFAHVSLEQSTRDGIGEIVYYVQPMDDGEEETYVLRRADTLYPYERFEGNTFEERFTDPALCDGIKSLTFTYYDHEGTEYDVWNSESGEFKYATPRAVKIQLELGDDDYALLFETMVQLPVYRDVVR